MANFDLAFQILMKHEGGFVNNPHDMGGPTNFGITQSTLSQWLNRPVSIDEVREIKLDFAKHLYRVRFWEFMKLDSFQSTKIATIMFDQGVVRGPGRMIQDVQHILKLDSDGIVGHDTLEAINNQDEILLGTRLIQACQISYAHTVAMRPETQSEFIVGWITRTHSLLDYLLFSS